MDGMFSKVSRPQAGADGATGTMAEGVRGARKATPEEIKAASARLMAKGITPNAVNVAEEIAAMTEAPAAAPAPAAPGAGRAGPQGSPEMLDRIKAEQAARNRALLEKAMRERRALSGAR
jgi:hypothetical protein